MRRRIGCAVALAACLAGAASGAATAVDRAGAGAHGYIVVYRDGVARPGAQTTAVRNRLGFNVDFRYSAALDGYAAQLTPAQLAAVRDEPDVAFVTPDGRAEVAGFVPVATGDSVPTGLRRIGAATHVRTREASTTNVAVLDTGIHLSHPDLNAVGGTNCVAPGTPPSDRFGHGTHVAGTIGALNNGSGVVGVAPGTKIFSVKVLDDSGHGSFADIICGIDWVTANHVPRRIGVANMSITANESIDPTQPCATTTSAMHKAICNSTAAGVNYVIAAGNDGGYFDDPTFPYIPAAFPQVLTVTAMQDHDGRPGALGGPSCYPFGSDDSNAGFSNYAAVGRGDFHTIAAPGVCIESTFTRPPYKVESGTSVASPHVAGLVALCMGEVNSGPGPCAGKAPDQVIKIMRSQASGYAAARPDAGFWGDPDDPLWPRYYGYLARARAPATGQ